MTARFDLYFTFSIPILEVIYREDIRAQLSFLRKSDTICRKLEEIYFKKRQKDKKFKITPVGANLFVPKIGNIKFRLNTESYNFYRNIRNYMCEKEPIRPLIAFKTDFIRWKINENDLVLIRPRKRFEIYPFLVGSIIKRVSLIVEQNSETVFDTINKLTRFCSSNKKLEKLDILSAIFEDSNKVFIQESSVHTTIVTNFEFKKILKLKSKGTKIIKINDIEIIFLNFNKILILKHNKCSKLFLERIIQTIQFVINLKVIADRVIDILGIGTLENISINEKFEFIEFTLATLILDHISSIDNMRILPKHYQRVVFKQASNILSLRKYEKLIIDTMIQEIQSWELREQIKFIQRKNRIVNKLNQKFKIEREQITEPILSEKQRVILEFLLNKYKETVTSLRIEGLKIQTNRPFGSVTANQIRNEIHYWLEKTNQKTNLITDNELKKTPPNIIADLNRKGLVQIKKPEKGRISFLYYLNEKDEYIQVRLRGL